MDENKINLIPVCIPEDKCKAKFDHHSRLIKVCSKCQNKHKEILDKSFIERNDIIHITIELQDKLKEIFRNKEKMDSCLKKLKAVVAFGEIKAEDQHMTIWWLDKVLDILEKIKDQLPDRQK